jgi:serine/threonine protein kinase
LAKLLDFGLAKHVTDPEETATIEGTVLGTAAYMAPEQAEGKPLDARSDVFSFGTVLYELLSGQRAFHGENSISTMAAILHKEPAPLEAPATLQAIVKKMHREGARAALSEHGRSAGSFGGSCAGGHRATQAALHCRASIRQPRRR